MTPTDEEREFMAFAKRGLETGWVKRPVDAPSWDPKDTERFLKAWRRQRRRRRRA